MASSASPCRTAFSTQCSIWCSRMTLPTWSSAARTAAICVSISSQSRPSSHNRLRLVAWPATRASRLAMSSRDGSFVKWVIVATTFLKTIYLPPWEDSLLSSELYHPLVPKVKRNGASFDVPGEKLVNWFLRRLADRERAVYLMPTRRMACTASSVVAR